MSNPLLGTHGRGYSLCNTTCPLGLTAPATIGRRAGHGTALDAGGNFNATIDNDRQMLGGICRSAIDRAEGRLGDGLFMGKAATVTLNRPSTARIEASIAFIMELRDLVAPADGHATTGSR